MNALRLIAPIAALGAGLGFADAAAAKTWTTRLCIVDQVAVIDQRVHIKCNPDPSKAYTKDITHYAMPFSAGDAPAETVVALAIASKQLNKPLVLWFDMDDYASVPGCLGSNCRRLRGAGLE